MNEESRYQPSREEISKAALQYGLPRDASFEEVLVARDIDSNRRLKIQLGKLGLPESSTWLDVGQEYEARQMESVRVELGLPQNTPVEEIRAAAMRDYINQKKLELNLPEKMSDKKVLNLLDKKRRQGLEDWSKELGLPRGSGIPEIVSHYYDNQLSLDELNYRLINLSS